MPPQGNNNNNNNTQRQHGVKGVYYAGKWVNLDKNQNKIENSEHDMEDFLCQSKGTDDGHGLRSASSSCRLYVEPCPRSHTRVSASSSANYDVVIVGAGCIGAAIARELSRYKLSVLWLEVSLFVRSTVRS